MSGMLQTRELATVNLRLLEYMQLMALTAQTAAAKRVFELFAQKEMRWIESNGGFPLSEAGHGTGGEQTPPASASAGRPVRLMRSGSRIERTEALQQKSNTTKGEPTKKSTGRQGKKVSFQVTAEPGSAVFVAGSFNDWNTTQYRMSDNPGSGHCKTTLVLPPGRHEYKFIVNGEWRDDPNCPDRVPNESGSMNSVLTV